MDYYKNCCECGNNKFIIHADKMYEGFFDEKNILVCLPDSEYIELIRCSNCGKEFAMNGFKEIDW
ncbi:MAG: hypothetical protein J7K40_13995 [candidate division Zixibacteria bacterium]|nr:hypothetical protein [candidate division Zixibacteria bacterium]